MTPTKEQTYILREDVEKIIKDTIHKYLYELDTTGMEPFDVRDEAWYELEKANDKISSLPTHKLPQTNEWISVSEELPDKEGLYLATYSQGGKWDVPKTVMFEDGKFPFPSEYTPLVHYSHWMNLPEPPAKVSPLPPKQ